MRILLIDGPGARPASHARAVGDALQHFGHHVAVRTLQPRGLQRQVARLKEIHLGRRAPDVVHVLSSAPWVAEAFVGHGVPVVHTTEDRPSRADWLITPSRAGLSRIAGGGNGLDLRVGVLPYAVPRMEEEKGYGRFALALHDPMDRPAARWILEAALQVPYVPIRDEGAPRDARFVIAVSSRSQAWPRGVAESMAAGRPVLATWIGAVPECVREGITGYLSGPGDVKSLARHMGYLWDRPEEALRMGRFALELAADLLDPERHGRTLLRWYMRAGASRLAV